MDRRISEEEMGRRIRDLTKKEVQILWLTCNDCTEDEIMGEIRVQAVKTVRDYRTKINKKLLRGDIIVPERERQDYIYFEFCTTVKKIIPDEDAIERWRRIPYEKGKIADKEPVVRGGETRTEQENNDEAQTESAVIPAGHREHRVQRRINWRLVGTLTAALLIILFFGIRSLITNRSRSVATSNTTTVQTPNLSTDLPGTQLVTEMAFGTANPTSPDSTSNVTDVQPTLQNFIETVENAGLAATALSLTDTSPPPLSTPEKPEFTRTPSSSPTPESILFEYDFSGGLEALLNAWEVISGNPRITGDVLTTDVPNTWLAIGEESWKDYKVDFRASNVNCSQTNAVAVRFQDVNNMVVLRYNACVASWFVVVNGEWMQQPGTNYTNDYANELHIVVTAEGDRFQSESHRDFRDLTYSSGRVAILISPNIEIDDFKVIELP